MLKTILWRTIFIATMSIAVAGCGSASNNDAGPGGGAPAKAIQWGVQQKTSGCVMNGKNPDQACTPGAIFPVAADEVCKSGYSKGVRNVSQAEKDQVYAEYGITSRSSGEYEVDHFVSLELGGSNDISNLWPEPAEPRPAFHEKDSVENYLHEQVCSGAITLQEAQREIATDWLAVYQRMAH